MPTNIEWANLTDNIIRAKRGGWWCQKISEGCKNCYSEKLNQNSFFGGNKQPYSGQPPELVLDTETIRKWGFQRKPKKHFVSSMTDVFGEWIPRSWQHEMLDGMFVLEFGLKAQAQKKLLRESEINKQTIVLN
ncbi:MAG: DUF5131 family protein [Nostoc sp. DedQUE04]|uniref:DUF5131 family protein n=1 Tax=Nostoc sp. DedQUE04 TaxID=3075390 RepID=UPI002AD2B9F3|nr:DUF5131 family protein [Nostoc sp. DedQUE04]MDZ8140487.1 DUF5131 family protein [Nostoc sp. DedQUE04]